MSLDLDAYLERPSWIHRWDPRCKLVGLSGLIFACTVVRQVWLLLPMVGVAIALYGLSLLPLSYGLRRLRYPGLFLIGIVALLPFLSGNTIIWQCGWLTIYREGALAVLFITARFFSIVTIALVLIGTTPFLVLLATLRSLGISPILTDMTLLTYRYLFDIRHQFATMQTAMRLRGGQRSQHRGWRLDWALLTQFAELTGTLLIRSYEQSERVYQAMWLRGYSPQAPLHPALSQPLSVASVLGVGVTWLIAGSFVVAEVFH